METLKIVGEMLEIVVEDEEDKRWEREKILCFSGTPTQGAALAPGQADNRLAPIAVTFRKVAQIHGSVPICFPHWGTLRAYR